MLYFLYFGSNLKEDEDFLKKELPKFLAKTFLDILRNTPSAISKWFVLIRSGKERN